MSVNTIPHIAQNVQQNATQVEQLEFKVVEPANESLERATHEWLRQALFFIGASWYVNRKEFKTVYEVSGKLKLRWLFNYNRVKVVIEQKERQRNWMGGYSIGDSDPFVLDCNGHDDTVTIEGIVKAYLPKIEIVQCGICGARFGNELLESGWRCRQCIIDFPIGTIDESGFVYVFGSIEEGYYKIGSSSTPDSRLKDYERSKLPFPVKMLHTIPVDNKLEAENELKKIYRPKRTNGEWYKLDSVDFGAVMNLKKYVAGHWSTFNPVPYRFNGSD